MPSAATHPRRLLDPATLSSLRSLELVAKAVVEGFVMGLHRSPRLGFSQEFAEYRSYNEGDDPRFIDWGVYGRTDRMFVRQFKGETNTRLTIMLDCSASMDFKSADISKLDYGRYLAASIAYLALRQHDAVGALCFANDVVSLIAPASRQGQLHSILAMLENAKVAEGTNFQQPFKQFRALESKRGVVVVISDFYSDAESLLHAIRPLAQQGQDIVLFQLLDPSEQTPDYKGNVLLEDVESGQAIEVDAEYLKNTYPGKLAAHLGSIETAARRLGADYALIDTREPLDTALKRYLRLRERRR